MGGGGGWLFPRLSDFSFLLFGHIVAKFHVNWFSRGVAAVIFQPRGHEKSGAWKFLFLFKIAEICREVQFESGKQLLAIKVWFRINKPDFRGLIAEPVTCSLVKRPDFMTSYLEK